MQIPFSPVRYEDGYLPIKDHGLIGDGQTAALIGRDGAVWWLCVPRFDSPPLFCAILDAARGGSFQLNPDGLLESRQSYETDSGVLHTELRTTSGLLRVTDALTLRAGADLTEDVAAARQELVRRITVVEGEVRLTIDVRPREAAQTESTSGGVRIRFPSLPDLELCLHASIPLDGLRTKVRLRTGDIVYVTLRWGSSSGLRPRVSEERTIEQTVGAWRRWIEVFRYQGPQPWLVRRSAITLKMLDHFASGAMVASPTSSLPEAIGGIRNWDYRYVWIRDAAFSVYALHRIGHSPEAANFLAWILDAVERDGRPLVLYDIDGRPPGPERLDTELEGYRGSQPVRWSNGAAQQTQLDVYGEILDCAYQWAAHHGSLDAALWARLASLVEQARSKWRVPDHGIWEVRTASRPFTYSAALCQVALDRGARLAGRFGLPGDVAGWRATADHIREVILEEAWNPEVGALTEHLGGGSLDASLLSLPLRRVLPASHPRMLSTTEAIVRRLGAGQGLLYRYLPQESPDGLPGHEGAFLICSFWLVDNLAYQGRLKEATDLYDSLCARAMPLGLLPEQIDPGSGAFLGNFPQAFSHIGVISSGYNLSRLLTKDAPKKK